MILFTSCHIWLFILSNIVYVLSYLVVHIVWYCLCVVMVVPGFLCSSARRGVVKPCGIIPGVVKADVVYGRVVTRT